MSSNEKQQDGNNNNNKKKDWFLQQSIGNLTKIINNYDKISEQDAVPENQDCLFCSRIPQNRRSSKIGLRSHMFQCSVRRTLLNGHVSNNDIELSTIQDNFRQEYNNTFQYEMNIKEPIISLTNEIENLCLTYVKNIDNKSDNRNDKRKNMTNIICSISHIVKQLLPKYIKQTTDIERYFNNKLYQTINIDNIVQSITICMFSHFISCNVKESLPLIYHLFENLKFKHDDGNTFATKLWMKAFVGLNNDGNQCNTYIKPILGSKQQDVVTTGANSSSSSSSSSSNSSSSNNEDTNAATTSTMMTTTTTTTSATSSISNSSNNIDSFNVINTLALPRNTWESILSTFIYRSINNGNSENISIINIDKDHKKEEERQEIGTMQLPSNEQIRMIAQRRNIISRNKYKNQILSSNSVRSNKYLEELQRKELSTHDGSFDDFDQRKIFDDEEQNAYQALMRPQGPPIFTLNQAYIKRQNRHKALIRNTSIVKKKYMNNISARKVIDLEEDNSSNEDSDHDNNNIENKKKKTRDTYVTARRRKGKRAIETTTMTGANNVTVGSETVNKKRKIARHKSPPSRRTKTNGNSSMIARKKGSAKKYNNNKNNSSNKRKNVYTLPSKPLSLLGDFKNGNSDGLNVHLGQKVRKGKQKLKYNYVKKKKQWDEFSDLHLKQLVDNVDDWRNVDWRNVSKELPGYTEGQCRQRWHELKTDSETPFDNGPGDWSMEEDKALAQWKRTFGNKWTDIAKQMLGRTELMVKNRFYSCMRKIKRNDLYRLGQLGNKEKKYMATTHLEKFLVQQMRCGLIPIPDPPYDSDEDDGVSSKMSREKAKHKKKFLLKIENEKKKRVARSKDV